MIRIKMESSATYRWYKTIRVKLQQIKEIIIIIIISEMKIQQFYSYFLPFELNCFKSILLWLWQQHTVYSHISVQMVNKKKFSNSIWGIDILFNRPFHHHILKIGQNKKSIEARVKFISPKMISVSTA